VGWSVHIISTDPSERVAVFAFRCTISFPTVFPGIHRGRSVGKQHAAYLSARLRVLGYAAFVKKQRDRVCVAATADRRVVVRRIRSTLIRLKIAAGHVRVPVV